MTVPVGCSMTRTELLKNNQQPVPALVDQGSQDSFLEQQLKPDVLAETAQSVDYPLELRMQEGYDHSYYFIASFIDDHLRFHAQHLL